MTCREWAVELVEYARSGQLPGAELQNHMRECAGCNDRWEDELRLSERFQAIRAAAAARQPSTISRQQLMLEFDRAHQGGVHVWLKWALNAAAILLVVVALAYDWRIRHQAASLTPKPANSASLATQPELASGGAVDEAGFIDVPYALPLASGEFVQVMRTELEPAALARMGIDVDAADGAEIQADVLLGEDGFPRGVRVLPDAELLRLE
ncbi:MAG: hypothetical protein LAP39_06910 [Acidobacteriia bacterium]|nr:hypothetical protein [Terriglobia bacterium]